MQPIFMKFSAFVGYLHLALLTKKLCTYVGTLPYTGDQTCENRHWPVVCQRSRLRTGTRSASRPHNTRKLRSKNWLRMLPPYFYFRFSRNQSFLMFSSNSAKY